MYFPKEAEKYAQHPLFTVGIENIPPQGPIILLINHYNAGPDNGMWTYSAVSNLVASNTDRGWEKRFRFVVKPEYEFSPGKNNLVNRLKAEIGHRATHILRNTAEAADAIAAASKDGSVMETIKNGDVLLTFPAGVPEYELSEGIEDIATLIRLGLRQGATIIPTGTYHKKHNLHVNFGKPITKADIEEIGIKEKQKLVDHAMGRIAEVLPFDMRGDYSDSVNPPTSSI